MSEKNKNPDPIERFFEKKVWEYDIPYKESDWMSLEERLEVQEQQAKRAYRKRWLTAAAVVLVALLGFFTFKNYTQINQINQQLANQQGTTQAHDNDKQISPTESGENPVPRAEREESKASSNRQIDEQGALNTTTKNFEEVNNVDSGDQQELMGQGNQRRGSLPLGRSETLFVPDIECDDCTLSKSGAANLEASSLITRQINTIEPTDGEPPPYFATTAGDGRPVHSDRPVFRIGLLAGPDLSTAGSISRFQNPGYTLGLHLEYNLAPRFSIRAGVQHSTVRYTAGSNDYHPPSGYWAGNIAATRTTAECLLLDIPVNLKYEVVEFENSRFFASAGIDSYIMLNERYRFDYNYDQNNLPQEWSEKTGTGYWLSNATVSFGYEFDLRSNWSLRAEPYLKVPLKGVGWGNVDLFSTGTLVSLNYNFRR